MIRPIAVFLTGALLSGAVQAEVDPIESRLLAGVSPLLYWENIERKAAFLVAPATGQSVGRLQTFRLQAGRAISLQIPAGASLRLRRPVNALSTGDIVGFDSNGSGLLIQIAWLRSTDGRDLVFRNLRNLPSTVTIMRQAGASHIDIAFFVSKLVYPRNPVPYRSSFNLGTRRQTVRSISGSRTVYEDLRDPMTVTVIGPARIALATRLPYNDAGDDRQQTYRIETILDDRPWQALEYETMPTVSDPVTLEGSELPVGRERTEFLEVPAGRHMLTLRPSRPLLVRAAAYDLNAFLLPGLNAPADLEAAHAGTDTRAPMLWAVPPAAAGEDLEPGLLEQSVRRIARGNDRQAGGLVAAARLGEAARARPGDRALALAEDMVRGSHTFLRDVLPTDVQSGQQRRVELPALDERTPPTGYAVAVPTAPATLTYALPLLEAPTELRLFVPRAGLSVQAELRMQFNAGPAQSLRVLPSAEPQTGIDAHPVATLTVPLPAKTRQIRIWRMQGAPELQLGMQYRAARPPRLSNGAYGAELAQLGTSAAQALFVTGVRDAIDCAAWLSEPAGCPAWRDARSIAEIELLNDWVPMLRLLRSRHNALFKDVVPVVIGPDRLADVRSAGDDRLYARLLRAKALALEGAERLSTLVDLARYHEQIGDRDALLGIAALALTKDATQARLLTLANLLRATGQDPYAAQIERLTQTVPDAEPSPLIEPAEPFIVESAGAVTLVARERALSFRAWIAQPDRPLKLHPPSGGYLRLAVRPLLGAGPPATRVQVDGGQISQRLLLDSAIPSVGLDLIGLAARAGTATDILVDLARGGTVTVRPSDGPALVTAEIDRNPLAPLAFSPGYRRVAELLAIFDGDPTARGAIAEAAEISRMAPDDAEVQALWRKFERRSSWRTLSAVDISAGVRNIDVAETMVENPLLRARAGLMAPLASGERFLPDNGGLSLALSNARPTVVTAKLALNALPSYQPAPVKVQYKLDDGPVSEVELIPRLGNVDVTIPVTSGDHVVRFSLATPVPGSFVRLRLSEPGLVIGADRSREHLIATQAQPLVVSVAGPRWVRVDELRDGRTISSYRRVDASGARLVLKPPLGRREALFRLFELIPDPGPRTVREPRQFEPSLSIPPPILVIADHPAAEAVRIVDVLPLGSQEDGTVSASLGFQSRYPTADEEDSGGIESADQFMEGRVTHRRYNEAVRLYSRAELVGRIRDAGGTTLGARGRLQNQDQFRGFSFGAGGSAYAQFLQNNRVAWSLSADADVVWRQAIDGRTTQAFEAGLFARHLSLDQQSAASLRNLDLDIYSRYRDDHRYGLNAAWRLGHTPWLDTRWRLEAAAQTNKNLSIDRASLTTGWEQLFGDIVVRSSYRRTRFFTDNDRARGRWGDTLRFSAEWDRFRVAGNRVELGVRATYRIDSRDFSGAVAMTWHFGPGRSYSDFAPGEIEFETLRERRVFALPVNDMVDVPQD